MSDTSLRTHLWGSSDFGLASVNASSTFIDLTNVISTSLSHGTYGFESPSTAILLGCLSGITLHLGVFIKGEWDQYGHKIFYAHLVQFGLFFSFAYYVLAGSADDISRRSIATRATIEYVVADGAVLLMSVAVYRVLFHRLRKFPGPLPAALSQLWVVFLCLKRWRMYEELQGIHERYGNYVRVGPRELSIIDPAAIDKIYGRDSSCTRGPLIHLSPLRYVYNLDRNKATQYARRKNWTKAFSPKAVLAYDHFITRYTADMIEILDDAESKPTLIKDLFKWVCFDITFQAVYGEEGGCLARRKDHAVQHQLHGLKPEVQCIQHIPWVVSLGLINPKPIGHYAQMSKISNRLVQRVLDQEAHPDFQRTHPRAFDQFVDSCQNEPDRNKALAFLRGDSDLALIAGWDNPANILSAAMFHIGQSLADLEIIRGEITAQLLDYENENANITISTGESEMASAWAKKLAKCSHLDAVLHETMRLHPPVSQGLQRMTSPEGLQIGEVFIPGDTVVTVPQYSLSRNPRFFVHPDDFIPARWTTQPDLVKDASVYMPFGVGLSPCPGRVLAMRMMRHILASIVVRYDFALASGVTPKAVLDGKREQFITMWGPMEMVFLRRK